MNIFIEKHQQLIKELLEANVDFILIRGYEVIYYGYRRTTGDMDLWLKPSNENKTKLIPVLRHQGFQEEGIKYVESFDFTKHNAFHFWEEPERVDCLTRISVIEYDEADKQKEIADIEGLKVPFINFKHLIASKITTGRSKDKADIDELQRIQKYRK